MEVLMTNRLNLIRTLSCCQCYAPPPSQAAHSNWHEHGKGKGIKADDRYTISLCRDCHQKFDTYGLGMDGQQSKAWFLKMLDKTNRALYEQNDKSVF